MSSTHVIASRMLQSSSGGDIRSSDTVGVPFGTILWLAGVLFAILIVVIIFTSKRFSRCWERAGISTGSGGYEEAHHNFLQEEARKTTTTTTVDPSVFDDSKMTLTPEDFISTPEEEVILSTECRRGDGTDRRLQAQAQDLVDDDEEMGLPSGSASDSTQQEDSENGMSSSAASAASAAFDHDDVEDLEKEVVDNRETVSTSAERLYDIISEDPSSDKTPKVIDEELGLQQHGRVIHSATQHRDDRTDEILSQEGSKEVESDNDDIAKETLLEESSQQLVAIPVQRQRGEHMMAVPNLCAICLSPYQVDQTIVWSPLLLSVATEEKGHQCGHAYHEECILQVLERDTTCPLCRQDFVILPEQQRSEYGEDEGDNEDDDGSDDDDNEYEVDS